MTSTVNTWRSIDGYVADLSYPSNLHKSFQPPWTDWQLERRGIVPPRGPGEEFTLVDLGCGDALGMLTAAASHPQGAFIGLDAMQQHIEHGSEIASKARLENVRLHCIEFKDAMHMADGSADYVAVQGVLAWIDPDNRDRLIDLAVKWLKPGGVLTIGYNCLPGWQKIAPFQKLVREVAWGLEGTSVDRFFVAVKRIRQMNILTKDLWDWIDPQLARHSRAYFAHEYLNEWWNPLWSSDVVRAFSSRGMAYVGQALPNGLRADLTTPAAILEELRKVVDPATRELASDIAGEAWYRNDIYLKLPFDLLDGDAHKAAMMERPWLLGEPCLDDDWFSSVTRAGKIEFDTPCARAIVERLDQGPAPLCAIGGFSAGDLINSIDAMFTAQRTIPVDPPAPTLAAQRLNAVLASQRQKIRMYASPRGALATEPGDEGEFSEDDRRRFGLDAT